MNPNTLELLRQGLIITVFGMGLVFAALALLWGLIRLLTAVFRDREEAGAGEHTGLAAAPATSEAIAAQGLLATDALTAERANVASIVAGALLANALPLGLEPPAGPAFEHGRVAPSWVVGNRSHALQTWNPPRKPETVLTPSNHY